MESLSAWREEQISSFVGSVKQTENCQQDRSTARQTDANRPTDRQRDRQADDSSEDFVYTPYKKMSENSEELDSEFRIGFCL